MVNKRPNLDVFLSFKYFNYLWISFWNKEPTRTSFRVDSPIPPHWVRWSALHGLLPLSSKRHSQCLYINIHFMYIYLLQLQIHKKQMEITNFLLQILLLLTFTFFINKTTIAAAFNDTSSSSSSSSCDGSIAECNIELEMVMESEISRRFLEQKKYISPGALKKDQPVCNGGAAGEPYSRGSGCLPQPSNTYNRGCSKYYRCRDDAWDSTYIYNPSSFYGFRCVFKM